MRPQGAMIAHLAHDGERVPGGGCGFVVRSHDRYYAGVLVLASFSSQPTNKNKINNKVAHERPKRSKMLLSKKRKAPTKTKDQRAIHMRTPVRTLNSEYSSGLDSAGSVSHRKKQ
jgi:hypothetical protein